MLMQHGGHEVWGREKLLVVMSGVPEQAVRMWLFLCTCCFLAVYFGNLCSTLSSLLTSCAALWDHWALEMSMSLQELWRNPGGTGSDTYMTDNWKGWRRVLSQTARNQTKIPGISFQPHWKHFFLSVTVFVMTAWVHSCKLLKCLSAHCVKAGICNSASQRSAWSRVEMSPAGKKSLCTIYLPLSPIAEWPTWLGFCFSMSVHVPGNPAAMAGAEVSGEKSDSEIRALSRHDSHLLSMFNPCS